MTLQEIQYKAQGIMQEWRDEDSAPYIEFVEELASMTVPEFPSNLDEVAEEYALDVKAKPYRELVKEAFKAGVEWMAGQGETHDSEIVFRVTGSGLLPAVTCLVDPSYKEDDKVIIQIRKK